MQDLISIVDDDPSVCRAVGTLVRSLGYPVRMFGSAEQFLESEAVPRTACVITDLPMPGMSGLDLQHHLLTAGIVVPLIFLAANAEPGIVQAAFAAGAVAFHDKPFDSDTLASSIARALSDDAA